MTLSDSPRLHTTLRLSLLLLFLGWGLSTLLGYRMGLHHLALEWGKMGASSRQEGEVAEEAKGWYYSCGTAQSQEGLPHPRGR